jgi:tricarballylate dehydrogenase
MVEQSWYATRESLMSKEESFDFLVVGCGVAGLSAAVSYGRARVAAGDKPRIALLEVAPRDQRGGASAWTMAGLRATRAGGLEPLWIGMIEEASKGLADLEYCRRYVAEVPETFAFLDREKIELHEHPAALDWTEICKGTNLPNGGGRAIVDRLSAALEEELGGTIFYQTELVRLLQDSDGRVVGVSARGPDGCLVDFHAPRTVLACGGFEGNPEMLTQYMGKVAVDLKLIAPGVAFNRGAGIRAAMEIGAGTAGQFDWMHAELIDSRSTRPDAVIYPHNYGILVNEAGKRFYDEGIGTHLDNQEVLAREIWLNQNQTAFFIADAHIRGNPVIEARFDTDHPAIEADTIADLADQLGLDPDQLEQTIAEYNAATSDDVEFNVNRIDGKSTHGLEPPKSNWAYPLDRGPYFAYPVTAAIVFTCGGLKVNPDSQVVTANGIPIPGLYAAGEITGLYYHQYQAGTSVLRGLTFGRVAGQHAAKMQDAIAA